MNVNDPPESMYCSGGKNVLLSFESVLFAEARVYGTKFYSHADDSLYRLFPGRGTGSASLRSEGTCLGARTWTKLNEILSSESLNRDHQSPKRGEQPCVAKDM